MLTDGKGRTVNFQNTVLVMTSNVGSRRILNVANEYKKVEDERKLKKKIEELENAQLKKSPKKKKKSRNSAAKESTKNLNSEEVMSRLENNPEANELIMEAASEPDIMKALNTAMTGSTEDILEVANEDPKVKKFLKKLWLALDTADDEDDVEIGFALGLFREFQNSANANGAESENNASKANDDSDNDEVAQASAYAAMSDAVKEELESSMKPELLNRIDEIVIFAPLEGKELLSIAKLLLDQSIKRAKEERDIDLVVTDNFYNTVLSEGSENAAKFGARPMRRAAQKYFEDPVSEAIIRHFVDEGGKAIVDLVDGPNGNVVAEITRLSDNEVLCIDVDDDNGGIGAKSVTLEEAQQQFEKMQVPGKVNGKSFAEKEVETSPQTP